MGVGTALAYPGSMIGAALSGVLYKKTNSIWGAVIGEIVGTGLLGGLIAYPVAAFVLDSKVVALWFFIVAFLPNTCIGAACGAVLYKVLPIRKFAEELRK